MTSGASARILQVEAEHDGLRLDNFLTALLPELSRSQIQRLIKDGRVKGPRAAARASAAVREGQTFEIVIPPAAAVAPEPEALPLRIVFQDEDVVVLDKPAGMVVHPAAGIHSGTLVNALAFHFQQLLKGEDQIRPGIVHRLDRDTSGLLVVAKTDEALENLSDQFRDRTVFKSYMAMVHGRVENQSGRIDQPLARDSSNRTRMAVVRGGRSALRRHR